MRKIILALTFVSGPFAHAGIGDWLSLPKEFLPQQIRETQRLQNYKPTVLVREVADRLELTDFARRLFYLNQPLFTGDRKMINTICKAESQPGSTFFGCYLTGDNGIYILDLEDARFHNSMLVTTAHEILHSGYHRLDVDDKAEIDALVLAVFNGPNRKALEERLESYRLANQKLVLSELHSFIGTEVALLPPELEMHYARYFKDRKQIVELHKESSELLERRLQSIKRFDKALKVLGTKLDAQKEKRAELERSIQDLQRQAQDSKQELTTEQYNSFVRIANQKIHSYRKLVQESQSTLTDYNQTAKQRNKVVHELRALAAVRDGTND